MRHLFFSWVAIASFASLLAACSGPPDHPPPLDPNSDGGLIKFDAIPTGPCEPPGEGCPCANPGEELFCGMIYRESNGKVDCAKGYRTCQEDGGWGPCEGPRIFGQD